MGKGAVVYNNEIHILQYDGNIKRHYKWDGSSWTFVSTLPYNFSNGDAVVYNNEIHLVGSTNSRSHYKWDGNSWTSVSTLPITYTQGFYAGGAVVYNNAIHILGGQYSSTFHYYIRKSSVSGEAYNAALT
jgi:N-acetylneuraminic acid mutarotase